MNKIGFQNFRRFQSFKPLEFNGITFLVGPNNSGKSTIVKALLLVSNYFKSKNSRRFFFGNQVLEKLNIINYGRAKNYSAEENQITFNLEIGNLFVLIILTGDDDKSYAEVVTLEIHDFESGISFVFDFNAQTIKISLDRGGIENSPDDNLLFELSNELERVKRQLNNSNLNKTSIEFIELVSLKEKLQEKIDGLEKNKIPFFLDTIILEDEMGKSSFIKEIVEDFLGKNQNLYHVYFNKVQQGEEVPIIFENLKVFYEFGFNEVARIFNESLLFLEETTFHYLGASLHKTSTYFSITDRNNSLSQAIYRYAQLNISAGEPEHIFILKWMREFGVGENFSIEKVDGGEGYSLKVTESNKTLHLSDKGMGSIQLMSLILKLATVVRFKRYKELNFEDYKLIQPQTIIAIEEPELNLHPGLQSKLADLFLETFQDFGLQFIIETHSEYVLRRSQVIVAENEFEVAPNENPFCVHYFPKDIHQMPYRLEYQEDGSFSRNFGDGFFDEASSSTLELLKLKRQKKA
ncbi:hypothetical protein MASR2M44_07070 [Bacteroidota bacterium]